MAAQVQDQSDRTLRLSIAGGVVLAAMLALLFGSLVMKLVIGVIALAVLQGLWRGASEIAGVLLGMLLAALLAPMLGRGLEGIVSSLSGAGGLLARFVAMAVAAVLVVVVVAIGFKLAVRIPMRRYPLLQRWDPYAGAVLGLAEGAVLALFLLWAPLVLEPVAAAQLGPLPEYENSQATPRPMRDGRSPVAQAVMNAAEQVHRSSLGPLAERTNPVRGSDLLALAADFAVVSRDPEAMAWLMESPVMAKIESLPSVQEGVRTLREDPELVALFDEQGVSVETLRQVLNSPRILELFDRTTIIEDLAPLAPELAETIREARARAESRRQAP